MDYTEQLQNLPKEDAMKVVFDVMNARALDAIEALKTEVSGGVSEAKTDGQYSDKHPKIDLYHNGEYVASTNWSSTVKHAVSKAKEKYPNLTGKITGQIAVKEAVTELSEGVTVNAEAFYKDLSEGLRKVGEYTAGRHKATIYKDAEWNEFRTKFHTDGKHLEKADHHTDDKADATATAKSQVDSLHAKDAT